MFKFSSRALNTGNMLKISNDDVMVYVTKWRWRILVPIVDGVHAQVMEDPAL
jgi:hypothetical protein